MSYVDPKILSEMRAGKFVVINYDWFSYEDYWVSSHDTLAEAQQGMIGRDPGCYQIKLPFTPPKAPGDE